MGSLFVTLAFGCSPGLQSIQRDAPEPTAPEATVPDPTNPETDSGAWIELGGGPNTPLDPAQPMFMSDPFAAGAAWSALAEDFLAEGDPDFVGFNMTAGGWWETVGPANEGAEWTAEGMLALVADRQDYLLDVGIVLDMAGLDVEGPVVDSPSYASRQAAEYDGRVAATRSVVTSYVDRYGPGTSADLPVGWYAPGVGGPYYFSDADLLAYRSETWPTGFPFSAYDRSETYRWASLPLSLQASYLSDVVSANDYSFHGIDDSGSSFTHGLGTFALEFALDSATAAFDRPEWQPILQALDVLQPCLYPNAGWPDVRFHELTAATSGDLAGLGGEGAVAYWVTLRSGVWVEAQTDRRRRVVPYMSGELHNLRFPDTIVEDALVDHYSGTREVWDAGWSETYADTWPIFSNTHVTGGQARISFGAFRDMVEAVARGAVDGGHEDFGIFYWEAWGYGLSCARLYLEDPEAHPDCQASFRSIRRVALHEWAIGMPGDTDVLDPIFDGHYDRREVWGPFVKDESDWTPADIDLLLPLVWKVRVLPYLRLVREGMGGG